MKPKKPGYNAEKVQNELIDRVCTFFGRIYDDHEAERHAALRGHKPGDEKWIEIMGDNPTINETAVEFGITPLKVRKILITGFFYDTDQYRKIKTLIEQGQNVERIAVELGMSVITVKSYLPYDRVIYNMPERSVNADRLQRFKKRHGGYKAKKQ